MSDKPIAERLQVKADRRLAVLGAPAALEASIGAAGSRSDASEADVALLFIRDRAAFDDQIGALLARLKPAAILWLAYPKLTSALAGDLNRDVIRAAVPDHGLDTVSQIALDDDWSALRLKRVS